MVVKNMAASNVPAEIPKEPDTNSRTKSVVPTSFLRKDRDSVQSNAIIKFPAAVADSFVAFKIQIVNKLSRNQFMVTVASCGHGAGATSVAYNFAMSLAQQKNIRVALIEANFRSPKLNSAEKAEGGLRAFLSDELSLAQLVQRHQKGNLMVLPSGSIGSESFSFQGSTSRKNFTSLRNHFDFIVIDAPPILPYEDTLSIASESDGVLLVLESEQDKWEEAQAAQKKLKSKSIPILAAILNKKKHHIPDTLYHLL